MSEVATILHISDLHLVADLSVQGGRFRSKSLFAKSSANNRLFGFFQKVLNLQQNNTEFDLVLGTGDLTTDGSEAAIQMTRRFFQEAEIRDSSGGLVCFGLNLTSDRMLLVPGNHDRYGGRPLPWQKPNGFFERILETKTDYPYLVGYRRPANRQNARSTTLLFFVFDSTPSASVKNSIFNRPARGFVSPFACLKMLQLAKEAVDQRVVPDFTGQPLDFDPTNCIRIAVLHHHPMIDREKVKKFKKTTEMVNHETFVQHCFQTGINLVLFGHEHIQYNVRESAPVGTAQTPFGNPSDVYFVCCPSAFEYSEDKNGFFLIEVDQHEIQITLYEWNGIAFNTESALEPIPC